MTVPLAPLNFSVKRSFLKARVTLPQRKEGVK